MNQGCVMTSAPDVNGNRFDPEMVEQAADSLKRKGHIEIMGRDTPLNRVWLERPNAETVECWIAWEEETSDA